MIDITYYRRYHRIVVQGHANTAPAGEDLLCAWASGHAEAIAECVRELAEQGYVRQPLIHMDGPYAEVSCRVPGVYREKVEPILDAMTIDFDLMQINFPDNVHYEIHG